METTQCLFSATKREAVKFRKQVRAEKGSDFAKSVEVICPHEWERRSVSKRSLSLLKRGKIVAFTKQILNMGGERTKKITSILLPNKAKKSVEKHIGKRIRKNSVRKNWD